MNESIVYVVDDDPIVTHTIQKIVEEVGYQVLTYSNAVDFLRACSSHKAGCLLLDVRLPKMSGLELQEELSRRGIDIPIIFITAHGDVSSAVRAMKAKALDFLVKPIEPALLLENINKALKADMEKQGARTRAHVLQGRFECLTRREREVMQLVVEGKFTKDIAQELGISPNTVEIHRARVMKKMQAKSVAELVNFAHQSGVVGVP